MDSKIRQHAQFDENDYAYLSTKGWPDEEILERWDQEQKDGNGPCRWDHPTAKAKLESVLKNHGLFK